MIDDDKNVGRFSDPNMVVFFEKDEKEDDLKSHIEQFRERRQNRLDARKNDVQVEEK